MFRIPLITLIVISMAFHGFAQDSSGIPAPVLKEHFSDILENSPFLRSVNLSDSLILTGIAVIDATALATLVDRNTKQSYVVSNQPNAQGWKMVELDGDLDLETITATISVDGSDTVKVRYDNMKLKSGEGKPAGALGASGAPEPEKGAEMTDRKDNGGRGRGGSDPEMREKMMSLSEEQRGKLFQKMMELREKKPDMSKEERGELMKKSMEKMLKKN
ncbi:hypothetical protein OAE61_03600 [Verrucomicrobiales bacterium]|nr:hypothetical protein [Verrucomicrobiales bacterium]MDC0258806.1 hypothetical protein [Verrucomicrobiales bacterium]